LIFHIKRFTKNNWTKEKNPTIVNFPISDLDVPFLNQDEEIEYRKYNLVANVCHESQHDGDQSYKVHIRNKVSRFNIQLPQNQWFEIQDLFVNEIMPQTIFLSEAYIQIWERT
jgi:U4/U6.U5 tri-snRNP-associated protein 2